MDVMKLVTAWPMVEPVQMVPLRGGTNNQMLSVETVSGKRYVLRLLPVNTDIARIRYEAALLYALTEQCLPFTLPLPLRASDGDIIVSLEQEEGGTVYATLHPFLSGNRLERNDPIMAALAGTTLAVLDAALARLPELSLPADSQMSGPFGDLAHCHVLVPDPLAAIERLPVEREWSRQVAAILESVMSHVDSLYERLPQQLLHRDYDPPNVLVDETGVTAVLDFEFAGPDIRVLELAVALSWWPLNLMGTGKEWAVIDAFGAAYIRGVALSESELQALPEVLLLRDMTSLIHRIGRYLAGLESDARMVDRVQHSLWREQWLTANREQLLEHALSWR